MYAAGLLSHSTSQKKVLALDMGSGHIIKLSLAEWAGWNEAETAYWEEAPCQSLDDHLVDHPFGLIQP